MDAADRAQLVSERELEAIMARRIGRRRLLSPACIGACADCLDLISLERLRAVPNVTRCLPCQQLHETRNGSNA